MMVPIDPEVPAHVVGATRAEIARLKESGAKPRLIQVHFEDLKNILDRLVVKYPFPFMPTLCGVPVEFGNLPEIGIISVRDDDTVTKTFNNKETWQQ